MKRFRNPLEIACGVVLIVALLTFPLWLPSGWRETGALVFGWAWAVLLVFGMVHAFRKGMRGTPAERREWRRDARIRRINGSPR